MGLPPHPFDPRAGDGRRGPPRGGDLRVLPPRDFDSSVVLTGAPPPPGVGADDRDRPLPILPPRGLPPGPLHRGPPGPPMFGEPPFPPLGPHGPHPMDFGPPPHGLPPHLQPPPPPGMFGRPDRGPPRHVPHGAVVLTGRHAGPEPMQIDGPAIPADMAGQPSAPPPGRPRMPRVKRSNGAGGDGENRPMHPSKLFVRDIPPELFNRRSLKAHFDKFGEVVNIHLMAPRDEEEKGRAHVLFRTPAQAQAAMDSPDAVGGNRYLLGFSIWRMRKCLSARV